MEAMLVLGPGKGTPVRAHVTTSDLPVVPHVDERAARTTWDRGRGKKQTDHCPRSDPSTDDGDAFLLPDATRKRKRGATDGGEGTQKKPRKIIKIKCVVPQCVSNSTKECPNALCTKHCIRRAASALTAPEAAMVTTAVAEVTTTTATVPTATMTQSQEVTWRYPDVCIVFKTCPCKSHQLVNAGGTVPPSPIFAKKR